MALISCSECGKQVSDKAKACPNCGAPISQSSAEPATNEPTVVYNPKQDTFLTRNRGCAETLFWAVLILIPIGLVMKSCE